RVGEQRARHLAGNPALRGQARRRVAVGRQVVLRAGPGIAHHVPAVGRTRGVVDDQRRGRALARGLLELVGPAAVVGHPLAFEQALVVGVEAGVVDQHDHGLALDVYAGVVVPVLLGGIHAVADEHQRAVLDAGVWLAGAGADHHVVAERERARVAGDGELDRGGRVGRGLDHRHVLEPLAVVARLQADALHLRTDVLDRLLAARGAG